MTIKPDSRLQIQYEDLIGKNGPEDAGFRFPGPPDWGNNEKSVRECELRMCGRYNFRPAFWMGDVYDDSQVGADNVCASLSGVHFEWNSMWYNNPTPLIEGKRRGGIPCKVCKYWSVFLLGWLGAGPILPMVPENKQKDISSRYLRETLREPCPLFKPVIFGGGESQYFGYFNVSSEKKLWESCNRAY